MASFLGGGGGVAGVLEPGWAVVCHFPRVGRVSGKRGEERWIGYLIESGRFVRAMEEVFVGVFCALVLKARLIVCGSQAPKFARYAWKRMQGKMM